MSSPARTSATDRTPLNLSHSMPRCMEWFEYGRALTKPVSGISSLHSLHVLPLIFSVLHPIHWGTWGTLWRRQVPQYQVPSIRQSIHLLGASASLRPCASSCSALCTREFFLYVFDNNCIPRFFCIQHLTFRKFFVDN